MKMRFWILVFATLMLGACARPIADFGIPANRLEAPLEVSFDNVSKNAETYEWEFGDGNTSQETSPEHHYQTSGNYTVTLKATKGEKSNVSQKQLLIRPPKICMIEIKTDYGNMLVELYDDTPQHRDNFSKLVESGFYSELLFHRVIDGFMVQGGDPNSKNATPGMRLGSGGPGYQIPAEIDNRFAHTKGALAAARMGDAVNPEKKSSGSQFYIVHGRKVSENELKSLEIQKNITYSDDQKKMYMEEGGTPFLDQEYTVFGRVIQGLDVIDKIASVATLPGDRPKEDIKMEINLIK